MWIKNQQNTNIHIRSFRNFSRDLIICKNRIIVVLLFHNIATENRNNRISSFFFFFIFSSFVMNDSSNLAAWQFKKVLAMPLGGHLARLPLWGNFCRSRTFNQVDNFRNHARNTVESRVGWSWTSLPAPIRWITMRRFAKKRV